MSGLFADVRDALRSLHRERGFAAAAILILAVGIGVNTAAFSVASALLLRPLPFRDAGSLAAIWKVQAKDGARLRHSPVELAELQQRTAVFRGVEAYYYRTDFTSASAAGADSAEVTEVRVSPGFFDLLGVKPLLGRPFTAAEVAPVVSGSDPGGVPPVILTYEMWQARLGGRRDVVGRTLIVDGAPNTVVGVMPRGFRLFRSDLPEVFLPARFEASQMTDRRRGYLNLVARLRPGVSLEQARAELRAFSARAEREHPEVYAAQVHQVDDLHESLFGRTRPLLRLLLGAVALLLTIACADVAGLLLARGVRREKEIAVRAALGAGRARLVRMVLTESLLLSAFGGAAGLVLAAWGLDLLTTFSGRMGLGMPAIPLDRGVLAFTAVVSLLTGAVFGLVPAIHGARVDLRESLTDGVGTCSASRSAGRWSRALVVGEIGLSLLLLVAGGMLMTSLVRLSRAPIGFHPDHVLTMVIGNVAIPDRATFFRRESAFWPELLRRTQALPEVQAAAVSHAFPMSAAQGSVDPRSPITLEGRALPPPGQVLAEYQNVSPGYFRALGIPIEKGRFFEARDLPTTKPTADVPVAILNASLARALWGGEDPIGKRIVTPRATFAVVGVVADVKQYGPRLPAPSAQVYLPLWYANFFKMGTHYLVVRTSGDPRQAVAALKTIVAGIDRDRTVHLVRTIEEVAAQRAAWDRLSLAVALLFSGIAIVLAAAGIYALVSHAVSRRAREIGIRMALGGSRWEIGALILRQGLWLAVVGISLGLAAAVAIGRSLSRVLYEVGPADPVVLAGSALLALAATLAACAVPARAGTRIDPATALRAR